MASVDSKWYGDEIAKEIERLRLRAWRQSLLTSCGWRTP